MIWSAVPGRCRFARMSGFVDELNLTQTLYPVFEEVLLVSAKSFYLGSPECMECGLSMRVGESFKSMDEVPPCSGRWKNDDKAASTDVLIKPSWLSVRPVCVDLSMNESNNTKHE